MNIESKVAIVALTENGKYLAIKIKSLMNSVDVYIISGKKDESEDSCKAIEKILEKGYEFYLVNIKLKKLVEQLFQEYQYIIFVMATGIVVRIIAPFITSKFSDPAILVMDEKGTNVISLLSGHMGGANEMTTYISKLIKANPVITTATDVNQKASLDIIAKRLDANIENFRGNVKDVNSMLVNNKLVGIYIDGNYKVDCRGFEILDKLSEVNKFEKVIVITNKKELDIKDKNLKQKIIKVVPKDIVIGIGCRRNTNSEVLYNSLLDLILKYNIDINAIKKIGSIDIKKDEKAIIDLASTLSTPFETISCDQISKVDYLYDKSDFVKTNVGVYCVAEPVAHILSNGNLIIEKHKYKGITISVGRVEL